MQTCIDACTKCSQACYKYFKTCLNQPDLNARKNCVSILVECAMICRICAKECEKMANMHSLV